MLLIITPILILICTPAHGSEQKLRDHDQKIITHTDIIRHEIPPWVHESRSNLILLLQDTCKLYADLANIVVDFMGDFGYGTWFPDVTIKNKRELDDIMHIIPLSQGRFALNSFPENDIIKIYDTDGNIQHILRHNEEIHHLSPCSQGTKIAASSTNGSINVWNIISDKKACLQDKFSQLLSTVHSETIRLLELPPHNLAIAHDNTLQLWNTQNEKCLLTSHHTQCLTTPLIKLATNNIAFGVHETLRPAMGITLWNTTTGSLFYIRRAHDKSIDAIIALCTGLLATSATTLVKVWDTRKGRLLHTLHSRCGDIEDLCKLPRGNLASGGLDGIDIWDARAGTHIYTFHYTNGHVMTLLRLPGGRLAAGGHGEKITIWDVATGVCLQTLSGHWESVKTLKVLPDGKLLSADTGGLIKIWKSAINPEEFRSKKSEKPQKSPSYCHIS
jgi:WD40 repeat protein